MSQILFLISSGALLITGYLYGRVRASYRDLKRSNTALQRMADERQKRVAELAKQTETLEQSLSQRQETLALRDTALEQYEGQIKALQETLNAQAASQQAFETDRAALDAQMAAHQEAVENARKEVEMLQTALKTKADELDYKLALVLTLSNTAYDGLLVINEQYRILASNTSAETLFGVTQPAGKGLTEVTGNTWLETMVENALANEEEHYEEQIIIHERPHRVRAEVIRRDGNLFIGLALQDVSELIRLNRARRDMVANISHELRTPIANIRLIIDGLFHDQDKPKRKDSISSLRAIARETDNLLWLVQEMADLSMIESGQAIVRMLDVALVEVISEAVERLTDQTAAKKLRINEKIPSELRVLCDRDLIQRVVVNLIHNAMKWSPSGGMVEISAMANGEEVTISVIDNGPGVADDQVERIFERFYQVDASRSGHEGGTGLGLAICRHIVEAHGGRIWAEGTQGGTRPGGRFLFTLLNSDLGQEPQIISPVEVSNA